MSKPIIHIPFDQEEILMLIDSLERRAQNNGVPMRRSEERMLALNIQQLKDRLKGEYKTLADSSNSLS